MMVDIQSNSVKKNEMILDIWGRKNPYFEEHYEHSVIRILSDYGIGASENTEAKGKILGAGYEVFILAYFIGLYSDKRLPLSDGESIKKFGQPIDKWGNLDSKKFRKAYSRLRDYIFVSLVAKTKDVDWIALDKGEIEVAEVVEKLMKTMEEYANYGFLVMAEKLNEDKGYFFSNRSLLDIFLQLTNNKPRKKKAEGMDVEPL